MPVYLFWYKVVHFSLDHATVLLERCSWSIDLRKSFIDSVSRGLRTLVREHKRDGFKIPSGRRQIFATCTQDLLTFTSQITTDNDTPLGKVLT